MKIKKVQNSYVTIVDQKFARDERLHWKSRGVFLYLWSQADNWDFNMNEVARHAPDGLAALKTALDELEKYGYLKRERIRDDLGHLKNAEWKLSDSPIFDFPILDKPILDFPILGNCTQSKHQVEVTSNVSKHQEEVYSSAPEVGGTNDSSGKSKRVDKPEDDEYVLAKSLWDTMLTNGTTPGKKKEPNYQKWSDQFRLMMERDGYDKKEIAEVINWCQSDSFWYANILSPVKLRKQYQTLLAQMRRKQGKLPPSAQGQVERDNYVDGMIGERYK